MRGIKPLVSISKERDAFTVNEAERIFSATWNKEETRLINLTAALTGMRISEILGIGKANLHEKYKGFAFKASDPRRAYIDLCYVLSEIGMDNDKQSRGLCFHSWRHFFNTYLLAENVPPVKVAAVL